MVNAQNLFREYILFRSRMVAYVAVILAIFLVIGLVALLVDSPVHINRLGLLLQILAVLALSPELIGRDKFLQWWQARRAALSPLVSGPNPPAAEIPLEDEAVYTFYKSYNMIFVLGNILASVALIWLLVDFVIQPRAETFPLEGIWRVLFSLLGFSWLNIFMLLFIYRVLGKGIPRGLLAWFFAADLFVGLLGVFFASLIHIIVRWGARGLRFAFANGPRRVVLIVSLPFFISGLIFELIATFL